MREELLIEYTRRYKRRITEAIPKYGDFEPETDKRNLSEEAIEEILDVGSYMEMCEQKHPELARKCRRILAKAIILYGMLKELKEDELELTRRERG
jgi:hypothetical protein